MEKLNKEEIHNEETIVFQRLASSPFNRNYSTDANKDNLDILAYDFDVELMKHYKNIKEHGDYTKALHNLTYIKNVDFDIEDNKWKIKKVKLLAKTNIHGIFIVDHIILSKGELWFMCEAINELYDGKYKIDGDGSIILEDYIDNRK